MGVGPGTLESVAMNRDFWRCRRVFLTGHTGFKGAWLALWLSECGTEVHGYALEPPTVPSFYFATGLEKQLASSVIGDVRDAEALTHAMRAARPEVVFHLAAQPLVRRAYIEPAETYTVNVLGTVNLLEAVRNTPGVKAVVIVTTDKCYENREWPWPYREDDSLGGLDPYSSSKACAELVVSTWRRSYLQAADVGLASARAGNVIGGGDWAADRLIPDFLRALDEGEPLVVRSPTATRPWQHVLEPLAGYSLLAEKLYAEGAPWAEAWNFGPDESDARTVQWIVETLCARVAGARWERDTSQQPHEAHTLRLDSSKARLRLGWRPRWDLVRALQATIDWHAAWKAGENMNAFSRKQIRDYWASVPSK